MSLTERGYVPKPFVRLGIRSLLRQRLREQREAFGDDHARARAAWIEHMRSAPIAPVPHKANEQHYQVPPAFFELVLGRRLKYSSGFYPSPDTTLDEAEEAMLALTAQRAELCDGQDVLELGCGWGSATLWMAETFPRSRILAVSNAAPQREHIQTRARWLGLANVSVVTSDMNVFTTTASFDRVVSVEMFEHMRNWEELLRRVAGWLRPDGRVFLHTFAHRHFAYSFEASGANQARDDSNWMGRHFFSGGMMPCLDLIEGLSVPLETEASWIVPGHHYARTAEDWLRNLERRKSAVLPVLGDCNGADQAELWFQRWRIFFLACAELFAFRGGEEWIVSHRRLRPRSPRDSEAPGS